MATTNNKVARRAPRRRRKGTSVVEFALMAPLLFTLILGIIEFGRAMMVLDLLNSAARAGGRIGVLSGTDTSTITSSVNTALSATGVAGAAVAVQVNGTSANANTAVSGDTITVTVSVPASSVSWVPSLKFLNNVTLRSNVVMRRE